MLKFRYSPVCSRKRQRCVAKRADTTGQIAAAAASKRAGKRDKGSSKVVVPEATSSVVAAASDDIHSNMNDLVDWACGKCPVIAI